MKPAQYIFLNKGLGMSTGKSAAQAAHAAVLAVEDFYSDPSSRPKEAQALYRAWMDDGHYAKYVMQVEDNVQMYSIERYLKERGFRTYLVIDEGRTEGTEFVPTAMGTEIVDRGDDRTLGIFSGFKLYKELKPPGPNPVQSDFPKRPWRRWFTD